MRTLVLGLGNPILSDDAVGLHVARELRTRLKARPDVDVDEGCRGGLRLMERMVGYDRAIVIDATRTKRRPGAIGRLPVEALPMRHTASLHDADLVTALKLGREVGIDLPGPEDIVLIGIEAADVTTVSGKCSPEIAAAVPKAVEAVIAALDEGVDQDDFP